MRSPPLRRLMVGGAVEPDRIFYHHLWYRGHTNRRYQELLPRLDRIDAYLLFLPEQRLARGIGFRILGRSLGVRAGIVRAGGRRYRAMLATEPEQVTHFRGPAIVDLDDPTFDSREVTTLQRPNVVAYTVTAEPAAQRFAELGVEKPAEIVPQGVATLDAQAVETANGRRRPGELVVGYVAAWLLLDEDRGGSDPLYNVEHLLELWDEFRVRAPAARLWLIGAPGHLLRDRLAGRDDVLLTGRLKPPEALAHVANFDIALYPRASEREGVRRVKIAEYLGVGVPTVAYDLPSVSDLREAGAGILVSTPREFVEALERLANDEPERRRLAAAAAAAGRARDWNLLAAQYAEILDRYLSPP